MNSLNIVEHPEGNTKSSGSTQKKHWTFTLMDVDNVDKANDLKELLIVKGAKKFSFQIERAPTTGKLHCQGFVSWTNTRTLAGMQYILGTHGHYEWAFAGEIANRAYCTKLETRVHGPWEFGFPPRVDDDILQISEYSNWQKNLYEIINTKPNNYKINWIYDPPGQNGKSQFARSMAQYNDCLLIGGRSQDGIYALSKRLEEGKHTKALFINLRKHEKPDYELLECIQDGIAFSTKYESGQIIWRRCWVWIFSNEMPEKKLSSGRIYVYTMEQMKQGLEFTYEII